jgi:vacuolar protein sorting-associated protein 52
MLRYRALFHFMVEHHLQLANEMKHAYMNTMRWYYTHHFDRFKRMLETLKVENKGELLGNDDRKGALFATSKAGGMLSMNDPFHLGDRVDILKGDNDLVSILRDQDRQVSYPPTKAESVSTFRNYSFKVIIKR